MIIIGLIISISAVVFLGLTLLIHLSFSKTQTSPAEEEYLTISIVIAAKNESKNLEALFNSLHKLNYPKNKYEIIFVNDNSTDNTFQKAEKFSAGKNIRIKQAGDKILPAKKGALVIGIGEANYDYIMITDADCEVEEDWLIKASDTFNGGAELIFGNAPYKVKDTFVSKAASFENLRNNLLTFSSSIMGFTYSCAARNFGFTKSAYQKLEGYNKTQETLGGDDDLLIREARKANMKIRPFFGKNSFVYSYSPNTWDEYFQQRGRHLSTSHYYLFSSKFLLGIWHLSNLLLLFSIFLLPVSIFFLIPFLFKVIFDLVTVKRLQSHFGYEFNIYKIFIYQIVSDVLLIIHFLNSFSKKDSW